MAQTLFHVSVDTDGEIQTFTFLVDKKRVDTLREFCGEYTLGYNVKEEKDPSGLIDFLLEEALVEVPQSSMKDSWKMALTSLPDVFDPVLIRQVISLHIYHV